MKNRNEFDNYDEVMPEGIKRTAMPIIFLLDVSGSMTPVKHYLNRATNVFLHNIKSNKDASRIVEAIIVPFNHEIQGNDLDWKTVCEIPEVCLSTSGGTNLSKALQFANDKLKERCNMYEDIGAELRGPTIFLVTDGYGGDISEIAKEIRKREEDKKVLIAVYAVEGYDKKTISQLGERAMVWESSKDDFEQAIGQFIDFASDFVKAKSVSAPGERIVISEECNPDKRKDSVLKRADLDDWMN